MLGEMDSPGATGFHHGGRSRCSSGGRCHRGAGNRFSAAGRHHPYRAPPQWFRGGFRRGFHDSPGCTGLSKPVKLFVGNLPIAAMEEEIRPVFEEYGDVIEVILIKDKKTWQPKGCCFIKYANSEEADRAIIGLHHQYTMPGGSGPITVRYADGERQNLGTLEDRLYVTSLDKQSTEQDIEEIFSPYGYIEDIHLLRDDMKQSRGCGFVKFSSHDMAAAALNALHGTYFMRGCDQPLMVRFANPKKPRSGESRGAFAYGGPSFGPRPEASVKIRPTDDPIGRKMPGNAWHQLSPQSLGPPRGRNYVSSQSTANNVATSSMTQVPREPLPQLGQLQALMQQQRGQPSIQQNVHTSVFPPLLNIQQGIPAIANQHQLPSSTTLQQLHMQPIQQFPSQFPQSLQQQALVLQSSPRSSQHAMAQLPRQVQQMQQSKQQQGPQILKQQSSWTEKQPTATAITSTSSSASMHPANASIPSTCDWTEHRSPEGYEYYYNSVTGESMWERPEELTIFYQQHKFVLLQQQQPPAAQQIQPLLQTQPQSQVQLPQQPSQMPQVHAQMQHR